MNQFPWPILQIKYLWKGIFYDTLRFSFSSDSTESMENMIHSAIQKGLNQICFTDHMDYNFPKTYTLDFLFDIDEYTQTIHSMQKKYAEQITIHYGIELGLQQSAFRNIEQLINHYPFDYMIGSVHIVDGYDPYYKEYWDKYPGLNGVEKYLETTLSLIKETPSIHSLGHLDYVTRYDNNIRDINILEYFPELIDSILDVLIQKGIALEINTSGLRKGNHSNPDISIVKKYIDKGGERITIGSDAHSSEYIAYGFNQLFHELKKSGISQYHLFEKGKPLTLSIT